MYHPVRLKRQSFRNLRVSRIFTTESSSSPTISANLSPANRYSMNMCWTIPSAIVKNVASLLNAAVSATPVPILIWEYSSEGVIGFSHRLRMLEDSEGQRCTRHQINICYPLLTIEHRLYSITSFLSDLAKLSERLIGCLEGTIHRATWAQSYRSKRLRHWDDSHDS